LFFLIVAAFIPVATVSLAQIYTDNAGITNEDIIDALDHAGVGIFKFHLDSLQGDYEMEIILQEYAGKDRLIDTKTLLTVNTLSWPEKEIRILSKIEADSYKKIKLYISTPAVSTTYFVKLKRKYSRKHYWVKFAESEPQSDKMIPLLFLGSEWDSIYQGKKTTRFCSRQAVSPDLSDNDIEFMPHFYIIGYFIRRMNF